MSRSEATSPVPRSPVIPRPQAFNPKRRRHALWLMAVVLAAVTLAVSGLGSAWQQARLREAYLPDLEAMAQDSPRDGHLLALLGARLMEAGEMDAAAETLRRALVGGDNADEVWLSLAATNAARGQRGVALGDLTLARHVKGDTPDLLAAQARVEAAGHVPGVADDASLTQALCPSGPQAILETHAGGSFLNGMEEWWDRRHPEISGYATRQSWVKRQPEDAQALRLWGLALERNRRQAEAGVALEQAVARAPDSPASHLAYAGFLRAVASPAKTGLEYIAALKLHPDWLPALLGLGDVGVSEGLKYGVAAYKRATEVSPQSAEAWIGLGRAYSPMSDDRAKAAAAFAAAARLAPARTDFLSAYADVLRQQNRWDDAEALLRRRLKDAPQDSFSHYLLGMGLMDSRPSPARAAQAEAETREALRLSPHAPEAADQLAQMLLERGDTMEALTLLQGGLSDDPYNLNTLNTLARAYRRAGQAQRAAAITARALSLRRDQDRKAVLTEQEHKQFADPHLHDQLADLFGRIGRPDRAREEREIARLLRSDPAKISAQEKALDADLSKLLPGDAPGSR